MNTTATARLNGSSGAFDANQGDCKTRALQTLQKALPADVDPDFDGWTEGFEEGLGSTSEAAADANTDRDRIEVDAKLAAADSPPKAPEASRSETQVQTGAAPGRDSTPSSGANTTVTNTPVQEATC